MVSEENERMKLLFEKPQDVEDRSIALWTGGPYCHVEIVFDGGTRMFSSSAEDGGVRWIDYGGAHFGWYDAVELPAVDPLIVAPVIAWANTQLGMAYDYNGVFAFVCPIIHDDASDWYCSEIVCECLIRLGLLPAGTSNKISPNELYKLMNNATH